MVSELPAPGSVVCALMFLVVNADVGVAFATVTVSPVLFALFASALVTVVEYAASFPIAAASSCVHAHRRVRVSYIFITNFFLH